MSLLGKAGVVITALGVSALQVSALDLGAKPVATVQPVPHVQVNQIDSKHAIGTNDDAHVGSATPNGNEGLHLGNQ